MQLRDFMSVCSKNIMLAATKIGADLARKQCVLGHICVPRILIEWQDE